MIFSSSLANSPCIDTDAEGDAFGLNRRSSSGGLLSPEVEISGTPSKTSLNEASESDGFYLLKKDSQRRATLSRVLNHDEEKICNIWMVKIESNHKVEVAIDKVRRLFRLNSLLPMPLKAYHDGLICYLI